jgi:hypothetical protein
VDHICAGIDVQAAGISCKVVLGVDGIAWAADGCACRTPWVPREYPRVPCEYPASTLRGRRTGARDGNSQRCASGRAVVALEESLP